ncbi:MAG: zinc ribbon domain-containing protein, partial [Thermoplasmata archaeon]
MSRQMGSSPQTGEAARAPRNWMKTAFSALVVVLVVLSGGFLFLSSAPGAPGTAAHSAPSAPLATTPSTPPAPQVTHGDLVVSSGETFTIQPTSNTPDYYQGGNITVLSGGTLDVRNVSLIFVEFVSDVGTPIQRLSHIYTFQDQGTVNFYNSSVTTDLGVLNAYAKLDVIVTGAMNLWDSALEFPGWLTVSGTGGDLTLNNSAIGANPAVLAVTEPPVIQGDTEYAASVLVTGGAHLNLFHSAVAETYADDTQVNGIPGPAPLNATHILLDAGGYNATSLATPTDSANLSRDWLYYPDGIYGGYVDVFYNSTNGTGSVVNVVVWYEGIGYSVGAINFADNVSGGYVALGLPAGLIDAINAGGLLTYLNNTGDFGLPSQIALNFSSSAGQPVAISQTQLVLDPPLQYNMVATGAGTTVTTVDAALGLTFGAVPATPVSQVLPYPWGSNKFWFEDGATGYLGNVSVPSSIPGVFSTSALLADAASTVYLFRWAQFNVTNLTSAGVTQVVVGAHVSVYYAYNDNQASNVTANTLNDIRTSNPAMWGYLEYWDQQHGVAAYGQSDAKGQSLLLLASSELNGTNLPGGNFLGGYHVAFRVPYVNTSTSISAGVSPYPTGVALGSVGYAAPDKTNVQVAVAPPEVRFLSYVTPSSPLNLNNIYSSSGTIFLNGPGFATITVVATPLGGGTPQQIAATPAAYNGTFSFDWNSLQGVLSPGTTYTIEATATYMTATTTYNFAGTYSVPATTSATGFLYEKFLGLPLWLWIGIAAAAVVAILVVLLVFRRQAAGKLVECGECGELIPEDATTCPKCGAEFESDLVRCSRCSSTIPANSQFCPECSAQLLGKPGEDASDPERQAYVDFTERFRAEGKKELGDNYTESAFWDWWKRQPTYVPFSQWKVQQNKGAPRAGMSQPPVASGTVPAPMPSPGAATPPP